MTVAASPRPEIAVVVPVRNEAENIEPVILELEAILARFAAHEVIVVDDGSTDGTEAILHRLEETRPWLCHRRHQQSCGKATAIRTGVLHAAADVIVTLDGDGQNDPAFIPTLVAELHEAGPACGLVLGQRVGRHQPWHRRLGSKIGNSIRRALLDDGARDAACGLMCFPRLVYLDLPFFDALDRFMPALVHRDGFGISLVNVVDRARLSGATNYGLFSRFAFDLVDIIGVWWLVRRRRVPVLVDAE